MKLTERKLLSIAEAARVLSIHPKTYERKAKAGDLPMWIYIGTDRRVVVDELNKWLADQVKDRDSAPSNHPPASA